MKNVGGAIDELGIDRKFQPELHRDTSSYIEIDEIWTFVFNMLFNPVYAEKFLKANQTFSKCVKEYWCCLGKVGLKTFCRLAFPEMTLEKRSIHRDHKNNFDEHKGPLTQDEIRYAILDAIMSRLAPQGTRDKARSLATAASSLV